VRQSKLEQVPSLALGTSPVTLKEMVSAYATIANGGSYVEPVLVTRIEGQQGRVLEVFVADAPEAVLSRKVAYQLVDALRAAVDRGTGAGIRSRFGIRADVAGKTGTTQDNADGWFILIHPQLVAGAWVGFNDSRVTLRSDYWGQGAHSALPIVGDFIHRALGARLIDPRVRFAEPPDGGLLASLWRAVRSFYERTLQRFSVQPEAPPARRRLAPPRETPAAALPPAAPESAAVTSVMEGVPPVVDTQAPSPSPSEAKEAVPISSP
jgi:penicillin-binding protein 1A